MAKKKSEKQKAVGFDPATYPYLSCREQHVWTYYDGTLHEKQQVAHYVQKCANCPMKRYTVLSTHSSTYGEVMSRSYRPPVDYRIEGGLLYADRGRIRMANFLSALKDHQQ